MNKQELITTVHANNDSLTKKQVEGVISTLFDVATTELKDGGVIKYPGFGSFSVTVRSARTGRNPQNGKTIKIPAKRVVKFKAATALKDTVNA